MIEERYTLADIEGRTYDEDFTLDGVDSAGLIGRYVTIATGKPSFQRATEFVKDQQPGDRVVFYVNESGTGCVLARGQRIVADLKIKQNL